MTSQIRSHLEYVIPTNNIPVLLLHSNLVKNLASSTGFSIGFNDTSEVAYFLGHLAQYISTGRLRILSMSYFELTAIT